MSTGPRPTNGGNPRTLDREELLAERVRLKTTPVSPERTKALEKIVRQLKAIGNRTERNGV
jgi:hypothetical protein